MKISILTSGSTGDQKLITHDETDFWKPAQFLCNKWNITNKDIILNPFTTWTIAHWAFCFFPAQLADCEVVNINPKPFHFFNMVYDIQPTIMTLAIGTMRTLIKRHNPDLSYLRHLGTGSAPVDDKDFEMMQSTGAQNVWNIYGSTECIPPVMISNSPVFDFKDTFNSLELHDTLWVDGFDTEDIFFQGRCQGRERLETTWKT